MFKNFPALRFVVILALGIECASIVTWSTMLPVVSLTGLCVVVVVLQRVYPALIHLTFVLLLFQSGFVLGLLAHRNCLNTQISAGLTVPGTFQGHILQVIDGDSTSSRCIVEGVLHLREIPRHFGCAIVRLYCSPATTPVCEAQSIAFTGTFSAPTLRVLCTDFADWQYCASQGVRWRATILERDYFLGPTVAPRWSAISALREHVVTTLNTLYWPEYRGVVKALVIGDKSELDVSQSESYALSGTAHVLAVSGLHVALICSIIIAIIGFIMNPITRLVVVTLFIFGYVLVCGAEASALRAAIMAVSMMLGRTFQRRTSVLNSLSISAVVLLLFNPCYVYSMGFQLSLVSVVGIACFYRRFESFFRQILPLTIATNRLLSQSFAVTLSASSLSAPLVAWYFSSYSFISPLANLIAVPLSSLAAVSAMLSVVAELISHTLAHSIASLTEFFVMVIGTSNELLLHVPGSVVLGPRSINYALFLSGFTTLIFCSESVRQALLRSVSVVAIAVALMTYSQTSFAEKIDRRRFRAELQYSSTGAASLRLYRKGHLRAPLDDDAFFNYLRMCSRDTLLVQLHGASFDTFVSKLRYSVEPTTVIVLKND